MFILLSLLSLAFATSVDIHVRPTGTTPNIRLFPRSLNVETGDCIVFTIAHAALHSIASRREVAAPPTLQLEVHEDSPLLSPSQAHSVCFDTPGIYHISDPLRVAELGNGARMLVAVGPAAQETLAGRVDMDATASPPSAPPAGPAGAKPTRFFTRGGPWYEGTVPDGTSISSVSARLSPSLADPLPADAAPAAFVLGQFSGEGSVDCVAVVGDGANEIASPPTTASADVDVLFGPMDLRSLAPGLLSLEILCPGRPSFVGQGFTLEDAGEVDPFHGYPPFTVQEEQEL